MSNRAISSEISIASSQYNKEENYWLSRLSGEWVKSHFPYDYKKSGNKDSVGQPGTAKETFRFYGELFAKLMGLCSGSEKTLHVIAAAGLVVLLGKYTGNQDIIIGTPIYKQDREGEFINTVLALRNRVNEDMTFKDMLIQARQVFIEANDNQNYPVETLLYQLNIPFSQGDDFPLFDVVVMLESLHDKKYIRRINTNMIFSFRRTDEHIEGMVEYNPLRYKKGTVKRIINAFTQLMSEAVSDVNTTISRLGILREEEKRQILSEFNDTKAEYPHDRTIHQLFQEQAEKRPDCSAVIFEDWTVTYGEFNKKINRMAAFLRKKGVEADTIVGIMTGRSIEMLTGIFAILKAGGAYLPIDAEYPRNRISSMLEDSRPPLLLTQRALLEKHAAADLLGLHLIKNKPLVTPSRQPIRNLDDLPFPDRSLVDYQKYRRYIGQAAVKDCITLQATRGCPYDCAYCHKIWPKKHVSRSAGNIFEEVRLYYDMGVRKFAFVDDIFNLDAKNSMKFFELIITSGMDVMLFFPSGLRGDILTPGYIDLMIEAGTTGFALALETASPRLQKLIGKNLDIEKLRENIHYICKNHPQVILELFTMHGLPTETEEEAAMTLDFIKSQKWIHFPYINILRIFPNTRMEKIARESGISREAILRQHHLAQHDFADTLPFDKNVTLKYQADFLNGYFLLKERLLHVLPYQMARLTEDEIVQKYDSYLPVNITTISDLLEFTGISEDDLAGKRALAGDSGAVPGLDGKMREYFVSKKTNENALRLLLLDLSQFFSSRERNIYDVYEPPLGLMYLLTYLNRQLGNKVSGRIAKSRIDFDNYYELKALLEEFTPHVIGVRSLSFYKDFFHQTITMIRNWGVDVPVIAGGPYATSDYNSILQDPNIDLAVLGEGEVTFCEVVEEIIKNRHRLPGEEVLKKIPGIAFIPAAAKSKKQTPREILLLDAFDEKYLREPAENPEHVNRSDDSAYVIYTSGSTGKPKGAVIRHHSLVNRLNWMQKSYPISKKDVILQKTPYVFDVSVWELFWWAIRGSSVCLLQPGGEKDPETMIEAIEKNRVTTMHFVPSMLNAFLGYIENSPDAVHYRRLSGLRQVFASGEALGLHQLEKFNRLLNAERKKTIKLVNLYGPTEATVDVSYYNCPSDNEVEGMELIPIGKPIDNIELYIVNKDFQLQPLEVAGELCIAGAGLARGYLNRPELTAEKFLPVFYRSNRSNRSYSLYFSKKIYKTGDLARWLSDGNIEFLGRMDHQVKIRGFRVEPGEIENCLLNHHEINESVVTFGEDNEGVRFLCAYIVANRELAVPGLKEYLSRFIPSYSIPSYFVHLEQMPLTPNGKVDRKALQKLGFTTAGDSFVLPRNEQEMKLAQIWRAVLMIEEVGINDNLFNIGGDSIKTIKLLTLINSEFQTNLKLADIYAYDTIEKLSVRISRVKTAGAGGEKDEIAELEAARKEIEDLKKRIIKENKLSGSIEDIYPMSDIEKGMVYHSLKGAHSSVYHDQTVYQVKYREFDAKVFKQAFILMVDKHAILRTCFNVDDFEEQVQIVYKRIEPDIEHFDISGMGNHEQEDYLKEFLKKDRETLFNITRPMWRLRTFALGAEHIAVAWIVHHAVIDGWSNASLMTELNNVYLELKKNPGFIPEKLKCTYKDFVVEQTAVRKQGEIIDYWKEELQDYKRVDFYKGIDSVNFRGYHDKKEYRYNLGTSFLEKLEQAAKKYNTAVKHLCFAAFAYMINMLSYENDIVVGLVTNSRPACEDGDKVIGCFVNSVPLRLIIPTPITYSDYIRMVNKKMVELKMYDKMPLPEIVNIIGEKAQDRNAIFDILFNYVDFYIYGQFNQDNIPGSPDDVNNQLLIEPYENTNTLFDLSINTTLRSFSLYFSYSAALFEDDLVKNLSGYFIEILNKLMDCPEEYAAKDKILTEKEKQRLLYEFNPPKSQYPGEKSISQLFAQQVERAADNLALVFKEKHLTYGELNERAGQLAGTLRAKGVKSDHIVGLIAERSLEMIVGILGILKAGGAYLPIDPDYPEERIQYILADSGAKILLSEVSGGTEVVKLNELSEEFPTHLTHPTPLCYVIYTSGTIGRPKGVIVEHKSVIRLVKNTNFIEFREDDRILQTGVLTFDASTFEIWGPLLNGLTLYLSGKDEILTSSLLKRAIHIHGITTMWMTSSLFNQMLDMDIEIFAGLRNLLVGGEALSPIHINKVRERFSTLRVINGYGPTENTTFSTTYLIDKDHKESIPIGRPIANSTAYIVDKGNKLQPVGVVGELWVGGDGVARGYLNNPELTAEKFLTAKTREDTRSLHPTHPLTHSPYSPIYKTGDLARWLPDGNIEFIGRVDHQLKIRGFRIEPGEIEYQLLKQQEIKEAVVVARGDGVGEKYLCAYMVSEFEEKIDIPGLRNKLSRNLPDYMIPSYFTQIENIPLTVNGKLDRKALPEPRGVGQGGKYAAPGNEREEKLVEIWSAVLGIEKEIISIDDDFFELGGHSLKATILTAKMHKAFDVLIPVAEIFMTGTIREISGYIEEAVKDKYAPLEPIEKKEYYPLSSAQKRLFFLQQMVKDSTGYNMPQVLNLEGEIEWNKLAAAFKKLVERHESLRTSFEAIDENPVQRVHDRVDFKVDYYEEERDAEEIIHNFLRPFDLSNVPLMRVGLIKKAEDRFILMVDMHHIITDGISQEVLVKEFTALAAGEKLAPLRIRYKDYSHWQDSEEEKQRIKKQEAYWKEEFKEEIPMLNLPTDYPRPPVQSFAGSAVGFEIDREETHRLKRIAAGEDSTIYMVLLGIFNILLSKLSGQEDIVVGTPVAGRRHADLEDIIGMFVNTLALRNYPSGSKGFIEFLKEVKERTLDAFENQEYQFEDLVDKISVRRDAGRNPLFDVVFVLQVVDISGGDIPGLKVIPYEYEGVAAKFDITLVSVEADESLFLTFNYCSKLFTRSTIQRFINYFKKIVAVIEDPGKKIAEIEIITEEERQQVLYDFNRTAVSYPKDKTIHELFADQAEKNEDGTAVVCAERLQITYGELNEKSSRLAYRLKEKGVEPGSVVGIMAERSLEMMIGLLGILKAGAAYLPIEPDYPEERVKYMLADSKAAILLDASELTDMCRGTACRAPWHQPATSLAYVIYTSGTTGRPRGVMVEHKSVIRLVKNTNFIEFKEDDRILQTGVLAFDASTFEIWGPLLNGLALYITGKEEILASNLLRGTIERCGITTLWMTASLFNQMVDTDIEIFAGPRNLLVGGEALSPLHIEKVRVRFPGLKVINGYGPTENTTFSATYLIDRDYKGSIPIGKPIANSTVCIVDRWDKLVPVGVVGELCVGGDGVSRGYLNNPELTAENYCYWSYRSYSSERIYKTGDLARWQSDGNIEFVGRLDHQVKIRGFRIELGEIENRLLTHHEIKEAVVVSRDDQQGGYRYLCAYFVSERELSIPQLRQYLSTSLPEYMIPSYFVKLAAIPLNPNGKLDRRALPPPEIKKGEEFAAPENPIEEKLVEIWSGVLGRDASHASQLQEIIGIDDNFFELGGHSLKAAVMAARVHKILDVKIPLVEVFITPTIRELAQYIKTAVKDTYVAVEPVEEREYFRLSSPQKRLYILYQVDPVSIAYNMPVVLPLNEIPGIEKLEDTFKRLIKRHESLRTSFEMINGRPVQRVHDNVEFKIEYISVESPYALRSALHAAIQDFVRPFDLSQPPLLRVGLIETGNRKHILILDMHHIITDGNSCDIMKSDFEALSGGRTLPPLRIQYKDFSQWQNHEKGKGNLKRQEEYWLEVFKGEIPVLIIPTDYPRPEIQTFAGRSLGFEISREEAAVINKIAFEEGATLFMVYLAIVNIFLAKISGREDIIVGTPIAGRGHADLEPIIGMFVNTLALRNYPAGEKTFIEFLEEIKKKTLEAFENQDFQFEDLVDLVEVNRDPSRNPLFDLLFTLAINPGTAEKTGGKNKNEAIITDSQQINVGYQQEATKFDLKIAGVELKETLYFFFEYRTALFKEETIQRFVSYFKNIISSIAADPHTKISGIETIGKEERNRLIKKMRMEKDKQFIDDIGIKPGSSGDDDVEFDF